MKVKVYFLIPFILDISKINTIYYMTYLHCLAGLYIIMAQCSECTQSHLDCSLMIHLFSSEFTSVLLVLYIINKCEDSHPNSPCILEVYTTLMSPSEGESTVRTHVCVSFDNCFSIFDDREVITACIWLPI